MRYIGVSNETSYGVMEFVHAAKIEGLPKIVSIQNSYSLLVRCKFEGMLPRSLLAELLHIECIETKILSKQNYFKKLCSIYVLIITKAQKYLIRNGGRSGWKVRPPS